MAIKKRKPGAGEFVGGPIYPDLPYYDDEAPARKGKAEERPGNDQRELSDLRSQVADLTRQMARMLPAQAAMLSQPMVDTPPVPKTGVDFKKLPDVIEKPEEYAKALNDEIGAVIASNKAQEDYTSGKERTMNQRLNALWDTFRETHKDDGYAADPEKVQIVAERVVKAMGNRGVDTNKYMFMNTEQFMDDVITGYDKLFGKPKVEGGEDEDDADADDRYKSQDRQMRAPDDDDNRDVGIFGGNASGSKPGKPPEENANRDMFDGIREWQVKSGFHS